MVDGRVKLRIAAVNHEGRVVDHLNVGVDSVPLDAPRSVGLIERKRGRGHIPSVDELRIPRNAHQSAPGPHADQLP
jgi:hypothetical protein